MERTWAADESVVADRRPSSTRAPDPASSRFQPSGAVSHLRPASLLWLQRSAGNSATSRLLAPAAQSASEAAFGEGEPNQLVEESTPPVVVAEEKVAATFPGGSSTPIASPATDFTPDPAALPACQAVAPTGGPNRHNGGGNDCTPGAAALTWTVVDAGATWNANVTAMQVTGEMHVTDWPSAPATMTVPNTSNPVDGGNINNTAGSANRWQAAIDDMADYDTVGGGRGPNWHSTAASSAHENTHWTGDYLGDAIPTANWTATNTAIDAMSIPKASAADAAAARTALSPQVTARFRTFNTAAITRWNTLITTTDTPGSGGRGYAAGQAVLNGRIAGVRAYATAKTWNAPPPAPAPGP